MGYRLREFNDVRSFPSLTEYVDSFDSTWVNQRGDLQEFLNATKAITASIEHPPWAVEQMIRLFDDQLRLLASIQETLELLKQTNLYRIEKGDAPVEKVVGVNIGHISGGKVNINSTDNSTNILIDSSSIFIGLSEAISSAPIDEKQKAQLLEKVEGMKQAEGSATFVERYKDFMQSAANHMTLIAPFIPALTSLLS